MTGDDPVEIDIFAVSPYSSSGVQSQLEFDDIEVEISRSSSSLIADSWVDGGNEEYDIAIVSGLGVRRIIESGTVLPVPVDDISNADGMYDGLVDLYENEFSADGEAYALPTAFNWVGYGYDDREVPEHDPSWSTIFTGDLEGVDLAEKVAMRSDHVPSVASALLHLGYGDAFDGETIEASPDQLADVREAGIDQRPLIERYARDEPNPGDWRTNEFSVGLMRASNVINARARRGGQDWPRIATPSEGALMDYLGVVVSDQTDAPDAAWRVVDRLVGGTVGAPVTVFGDWVGANADLDEHIVDYLRGLDADEYTFTEESLAVIESIDDSLVDRLTPLKPIENEESWEETWNEVMNAESSD